VTFLLFVVQGSRFAATTVRGRRVLRRSAISQRHSEKSCNLNAPFLYAPHNAALHKGVVTMIAAIERFFDALFAPLARELERMPASALRHLLAGF
jgi:hypothetical protein